MKVLQGHGENRHKVVLSLCDYSGNWPQPYHEAGHTVVLLDKKHGVDLLAIRPHHIEAAIDFHVRPLTVPVVLAAPLCTAFTGAAALHWKRQDMDGTTADCVALANACTKIIEYFNPRTWALENPRGRIEQLVPWLAGKKRFEFDPYHYAGWARGPSYTVDTESPTDMILASNRYSKRTCIWGECVEPERRPLPPIVFTTRSGKTGSVIWKRLGGKSERTKEIRSRTPMGFARAFQSANG